ncbi:MAG: chemotaxis protein CheW [Pseudomonadota bacterium]
MTAAASAFVAEDEAELLAAAEQYIRFNVGDHVFAVPISELLEILRLPTISAVPMSPPALLGLANLHGAVLPVLDLRNIFRIPPQPYGDTARLLVIMLNKPVGVIADRVGQLIYLDEMQIDRNIAAEKNEAGLLAGLISHADGAAMLINFGEILQREFTAVPAVAEPAGKADQFYAPAEDEQDESIQLIAFTVADQEYAVDIHQVEEVLAVPDKLLKIPNAHESVAGVFSLHNKLIPVFYLGAMLQSTAEKNSGRMIVASIQADGVTFSVGLLVDEVSEILQVEQDAVKDVPNFFGRNNSGPEITGVYPQDNGKRLTAILSLPALFGTELIKTLLSSLRDTYAASAIADQDESAQTTQIVVLRLGEVHFGLAIECIDKIVRAQNIIAVPKAPDFIAGVINIRGVIVPVVNQRRRFGLADIGSQSSQRIIVMQKDGLSTGYLVDSISQILQLDHEAFEPTPDFLSAQMPMIKKIAHVQAGEMIMMLDHDEMLNNAELATLAEIQAAQQPPAS